MFNRYQMFIIFQKILSSHPGLKLLFDTNYYHTGILSGYYSDLPSMGIILVENMFVKRKRTKHLSNSVNYCYMVRNIENAC